jgi:hypothetical protein
MDASTILQGLTITLVALTLGGVVRLALELGGFREWRKQVDKRLEDGDKRLDRHSEKLRANGHSSNPSIRRVR